MRGLFFFASGGLQVLLSIQDFGGIFRATGDCISAESRGMLIVRAVGLWSFGVARDVRMTISAWRLMARV